MADLHDNEENIESREVGAAVDAAESEALDPKLKKGITVFTISLIAVFLIILGYQYMQEENQKQSVEASNRLVRVQQLMSEGNTDAALMGSQEVSRGGEPIMGYKEIATKYQSLEAGKTAALNAGKLYLDNADMDNAQKMFDIALGSDVMITRMGAKAGMAAIMEAKGNNSEAAVMYNDAASLAQATNLKQKYTYFAGLNRAIEGNGEAAFETLNKAIKLSPASQWANMAKLELGRLGMEIAH